MVSKMLRTSKNKQSDVQVQEVLSGLGRGIKEILVASVQHPASACLALYGLGWLTRVIVPVDNKSPDSQRSHIRADAQNMMNMAAPLAGIAAVVPAVVAVAGTVAQVGKKD